MRVARPSLPPTLVQTSLAAQATTESSTALVKLTGKTETTAFKVPDGKAAPVAAAAANFLFRLGSGALCVGYEVEIVDDVPAEYSVARGNGKMAREKSAVATFKRPAQNLVLYEFEGCPFCRKVREAINMLDLNVEMRPCPQGGTVFREEAKARGGKAMFPFLVDPNTGKEMYESDDIIAYLFAEYGPGADKVPTLLKLGFLTTLTVGLGLLPRGGAGSSYKPSTMPEEPLVFYGYDVSPFSKIVREELCAREIPHVWKTCARGSPTRQEMFDKLGFAQFPYIEDPNTGVNMIESADIIDYLSKQYGK